MAVFAGLFRALLLKQVNAKNYAKVKDLVNTLSRYIKDGKLKLTRAQNKVLNQQKNELKRFDKEEKRLEEELKAGEAEIAAHQAKVEELIANKAKDMRILLVKIDKGEDAKQQAVKKISEIDKTVEELEMQMKILLDEKESLERKLKKDELEKEDARKKERLEEYNYGLNMFNHHK